MVNGIEEIIINMLPNEKTEAIYIFGIFGTEYFNEEIMDIIKYN